MRTLGAGEIEHISRHLPEFIHTYWRLISRYEMALYTLDALDIAEESGDWSFFEAWADSINVWFRFCGEKAPELVESFRNEPEDLPPISEEDIAYLREMGQQMKKKWDRAVQKWGEEADQTNETNAVNS